MSSPRSKAVGSFAMCMWRIAFVLALVVVATATHWPRLELSPPDQPVDKFLHASTFGILTALLWRTGWIRRRWVCVLVVAPWAAIDESTQAIPGLGRSAEVADWSADVLGVLIAGLFLAATRPVPGVLARLVQSRRRMLDLMLFDRPMNWFHVATGGVVGLALGGWISQLIDGRFRNPQPFQAFVVGGVLGLLSGAFMMRELGLRALQKRMTPLSPCLQCGAVAEAMPAVCARCGAARHPLAWARFALLSGREEFRICAPVVLQGLAIIVGVSAITIYATTQVPPTGSAILRFETWFRNLPLDLQRMIDITFIASVGAWTYWRCRCRLALAADRSGERCLACGYDLRASPAGLPGGVCGECGAPFVRPAAVER